MTASPPRIVHVHPASALAQHARLLGALELAFPVRFTAPDPGAPCDAVLVVGEGTTASVADASAFGVRGLAVGAPAADTALGRVDIVAVPELPRALHSVAFTDQPAGPALDVEPAETVLASSPAGAVWTRTDDPVRVDRVFGGLPVLGPGDVLRQGLRVAGATALVALVGLLRDLDRGGWQTPPLRAAFVFDDPNLRRPTYGHLDFQALVRHADECSYHAVMAMIPLDATRPGRRAAELFRRRSDRLSLVIHGNDHDGEELMAPGGDAEAVALCAQALRRIAAFERRSQVPVDRIMIPPHGRCSPRMARALGSLGYDALCAIHPCPWTADTPASRPLAGWSPAEFLHGCAILPRFPLTAWAPEIALRAFLGQPLVLYGHHQDVAGGLEPLRVAAERVNALGDVRWGSVGDMARAAYDSVMRDGVLHVRPWSGALRVDVPLDAGSVVVHAPPAPEDLGLRGWRPADRPAVALGDPCEVTPGCRLDVRLLPTAGTDPLAVAPPARRVWPVLRRRLKETADRVAPIRPALSR